MKGNQMKAVLDSIAQRDIPENINIWPQIAAKVERKNFMRTVRTRPAFALLLVLLALAFISGVAYAVGKITGYIPGVGIVDQSMPLRILAEPVVAQRDGLTVTISEIVADSEHTFIAYTIDGIVVPRDASPTCGALPSLQLTNGSILNILAVDDGGPQGAEVGSVMQLEQSLTYSSIPADVNIVTLTFPCILPEGTGPENWQISLKLSPAPKEYVTPAVEIGATFVASNPTFDITSTLEANNVSNSETQTPIANASGLHLDKVIELPNSYILVGNFTDAGDLPGPLVINLDPHEDLPHIEDGIGNSVAFKVREDIQPENPQGGVRYWAYEIAKSVQGPLTITLGQVNIAMTDTTQFTFDAGSNPRVGQMWKINLPIHLRNYDYVIDSVEAIKDGYLFKYHSGLGAPAGVSLDIVIVGSTPEQINGSLIQQGTVVEHSDSFIYLTPPSGQLTVELSLTEFVPLQGPWTLMWSPPNK